MASSDTSISRENSASGEAQQESCCDFRTLVEVFKALSDESRQRVLLELEEAGELRVGQLVERLGVAQPTMSHHLSVLRNAGLVNGRREGQSIYYSVNRDWLTGCCSDYLDRFQTVNESGGDHHEGPR